MLSQVTDDKRGYALFTAIHIPLYIFLLWGLFGSGNAINQPVVIGFDIFCVVHIVLHALFLKHPKYQFHSRFSWALILGAGIAGGIDLLFRL